MIVNQEKFKADLIILKYLQGTNSPILRSTEKELGTIMVQEAITLHYVFQRSEQKLQKSPPGSKTHLALMNYQLTFKV